jgi:hypothetical protein
MASFSNLAFDTNSFSVLAFDFGTPVPPSPTRVDTHDGFNDDDTEAKRKQRLHDAIAYAIDPDSAPLPAAAEVLTVAEPYIARMETGLPRIDWGAIEQEAMIRAQLYALAMELERQRQAFDEDEEDVTILLLH